MIAERAAQVRAGYLMRPPEYPLKDIFTPDVLRRLCNVSNPSESLRYRLLVVQACGPYPSDPDKAHELMYLRAQKAAWHAYLYTAFACGMFEGEADS